MCFYFANSRRALDLVNRYEFASGRIETLCEVQEAQYKITAFTFPACSVITANDGDNSNGGIGTAKWGLVPAWKKTVEDAEKSRKTCLNARAETVFELPSFRSPVLSKRCLIPATGYFEFHHRDKKAIPYYIFLKDEEIFSFGGIYEQWRNPATNETERSVLKRQSRLPVLLPMSTAFSVLALFGRAGFKSDARIVKINPDSACAPSIQKGMKYPG